jgi:branched-chain amino acid transport system substrate-binding protein
MALTGVTLAAVVGVGAFAGAVPSSAATSIKPVKLGFLWEVQGESSVAINDFQNGATLALSQINKAGGIGGHKVTYVRTATSALDMQTAESQFLTAVGSSPTMLIGLAVQGQVQALGSEITRAGIPLITTTDGSLATNYAAPGTSVYTWNGKASVDQLAQTSVNYFVKTEKYTKIGVMGTNESFGNSGVTDIVAQLKKYGLKPYAVAQYSPTATDLTQQVLAMKGAQAVIDWGYPNTVAVQLNQFVQNGINIPTIGPDSVPIAIDGGLVKGAALNGLSVVETCSPETAAPGTKLAAFTAAYKAKYSATPSNSAVVAYDDVYIAKAAIVKAGSTSAAAINKAMSQITVKGVCATYHADPAHSLNHTASIVQYNSTGTGKTVKVYTLPPIPKAS